MATWYGESIPPYLGVFLCELVPKDPALGIDLFTWVIVGDVPSARISPWFCRNAIQALDGYCMEMQRWIQASRAGQPVDRLIPVNVPPTTEYADMLEGRLELIRSHLVEPNARLLEASVAADRENPPPIKR